MKLSSFLDRFKRDQAAAEHLTVTQPLDLLNEGFLQDPYPYYEWLRLNDPVHRLSSGGWILTRYEDIKAALVNPDLLNSPSPFSVLHTRNKQKYMCAEVANNILPFWDGEKHRVMRKVVVSAFREFLEQQELSSQQLAEEVLKGFDFQSGRSTPIELISEFASPFAMACMCSGFGIPSSDAEKLKRWTNDFFYLFTQISSEQQRDQLNTSLTEFREYLDELISAQLESQEVSLPTLLAKLDSADDRFSRDELIDNCMLLFADGIENVDSGIGNMMHVLCRHPNTFDTLTRQPEKLRATVNEVLRYEPPAQYIGRIASADMQIGGRLIKKNTPVILALASGNRDEQVFVSGQEFDLNRVNNPILSFGRGNHSCIGAPLVRIQLEAALQALLKASPRWSLEMDQERAANRWQSRPGHRWLKALPLLAD